MPSSPTMAGDLPFNSSSAPLHHGTHQRSHSSSVSRRPQTFSQSTETLHEGRERSTDSPFGEKVELRTLEEQQNQNHKAEQDRAELGRAISPVDRTPQPEESLAHEASKPQKGLRFWLIFMSIMVVAALTAIDMTIISTALPTIVKDLPKSNISGTWITSAFLLTTTAFQPFMGGLADVIGRRNSLLVSVVLFLAGSIVAAVAGSMLVLVLGRGIQGVGGGGIQAICEIILSDLTTLRERGLYVGLIALVFAASSLVAPVLGGVFSDLNWRWIFYINLPIGGAALAIILPFMKLQTPPMPLMDKIHRMDIIGNLILLGSVISILIGVTEGGVEHPWSSVRIAVPLAAGLAGLVLFFVVEFVPNPLARDPILPRRLFSNLTAATCFFLTFVHGILFYGAVYVLPIYFQAIKGASPLGSAVDIFPATAPGAPAAMIAGILMATTGKYKLQINFAWVVMIIGFGLLYSFEVDTDKAHWVIYQLLTGFGVGAMFALTLPPIQASLPISELAHATATFAFSRSFGSIWGIAIPTAVFTIKVQPKLAAIQGAAEAGLTGATALGYATEIKHLPMEIQGPVREAYMTALKQAFLVFIPIAAVGLLASFLIKEVPLPDFNETRHGIAEKVEKEKNVAPAAAAAAAAAVSEESKVASKSKSKSNSNSKSAAATPSASGAPSTRIVSRKEASASAASREKRTPAEIDDSTARNSFDHHQHMKLRNKSSHKSVGNASMPATTGKAKAKEKRKEKNSLPPSRSMGGRTRWLAPRRSEQACRKARVSHGATSRALGPVRRRAPR